MSQTYDRLAAGERIRTRRRLLGFTQEEMAERIGRVPKYYADIERGNCGMSVETLLALAKTLDLSLDYIILDRIYIRRNLFFYFFTGSIDIFINFISFFFKTNIIRYLNKLCYKLCLQCIQSYIYLLKVLHLVKIQKTLSHILQLGYAILWKWN